MEPTWSSQSTQKCSVDVEKLINGTIYQGIAGTLLKDFLRVYEVHVSKCSADDVAMICPDCINEMFLNELWSAIKGVYSMNQLVKDPLIWIQIANAILRACNIQSRNCSNKRNMEVIACCMNGRVVIDKEVFNKVIDNLSTQSMQVSCSDIASALLRVVLVHEVTHCVNNRWSEPWVRYYISDIYERFDVIRNNMALVYPEHYLFIEESLARAFEYTEADKLPPNVGNLIKNFLDNNSFGQYSGYRAFMGGASDARIVWAEPILSGNYYLDLYLYPESSQYMWPLIYVLHKVGVILREALDQGVVKTAQQDALKAYLYVVDMAVDIYEHRFYHLDIHKGDRQLLKGYLHPMNLWGLIAVGIEIYASLKPAKPQYII